MQKDTATSKTPSVEKLALAAQVARRVQIDSIQLVESATKQSLKHGKLPEVIAVKVEVKASRNRKTSQISVRAKCTLKGNYQASKQASLQIQATFCLLYSLENLTGLSNDHIAAFGQLNGIYNVWPYWREFVQSTTCRMGLPSLTLPVFKVTKPSPASAATAKKPRKA